MADSSTPLEQVSSSVSDSEVTSEQDDKERRLATMMKVAPRLAEVADRIDQIQKVMGDNLPQVIKEQPLGVVVDLVAAIKEQVERLHGDGSTVVTNNLKGRLNYAREVSLPDRLEAEGVKNFSTDGWRVARTIRIFAAIPGEHKEEAYDWLRNNDYGSLIKPTVNASSLSAAAKELMEHGKELPEEYFSVHPKNNVSFTRIKQGRG